MQYATEHPAYAVLQNIGKEITEKVKPKAVVVFSGHWEAQPNGIEVNSAEHTDLIYECVVVNLFLHSVNADENSFYGFPPEFYEARYPNRGSPELASKILDLLTKAGIKAKGVTRGLDHGVWSGFHVGRIPITYLQDVMFLTGTPSFPSRGKSSQCALGTGELVLESRRRLAL